MEFFGEIVSNPAAVRIRDAASRDALPHALLLTGNPQSSETVPALEQLALYAAAAFECRSKGTRPCGLCADCRKIARGVHPDVVTVRDEEHRQISADTVRAVRTDVSIRPNEGARKVYCFPDCALLTERDQNLLLKVVEEGPAYAAFVFCAPDGAEILPTIRSRCVEFRMHGGNASNTYNGNVSNTHGGQEYNTLEQTALSPECAELCRGIVQRRGAVSEYAARLEKQKISREALAALLRETYEITAAALLLPYKHPPESSRAHLPESSRAHPPESSKETARFLNRNLNVKQLLSVMDILKKYGGECVAFQTGPNHILGALSVELEDIR